MASRGGVGWPIGLASGPGQSSAEIAPARAASPVWYDVTWNPTAGCSPVGPGCDHCDAMHTVAQLARMGGKGGARYTGLTTTERGRVRWTGQVYLRADLLAWPLLQRRPRRILVDSLSDLFHESLEFTAIDTLHAVMAIAHWHRFLVLTRRAERMRSYYADPETPRRIAGEIETIAATLLPTLGPSVGARSDGAAATRAAARRFRGTVLSPVFGRVGAAGGAAISAEPDAWPLPNLWPGVSVEDQARADRIGELLQTPAVLRWVRFEPLLGLVRPDMVPAGDHGYVDGLRGSRFDVDGRGRRIPLADPPVRPIDWVIAGGEIGAGARPTEIDWVRDLRDRCFAAGVPFLFRQWGEWAPASHEAASQNPIRRGRRAAGRLVDGRSWDEIPPAMRERSRRSG